MAFDTHLVAISWRHGQYSVVSQTIAHVDTDALRKAGLLHDVSEGVGYMDEAAIVQKDDFVKFLLPETNPWHKAAADWRASLPPETAFIVIHRAEWESGLGD